MARSIKFAEGEYYHIYNRGVDKRDIFLDSYDLSRFLKGIQAFNTIEPIGSLYELSFKENKEDLTPHQLGDSVSKLVGIVCYCLNPNHYHLLLKQVSEGGISKFMHRVGLAYTQYFNEKNKRSGVLFQGPFKAIHVDKNEYLIHLSAYINQNFEVHNEWHGDDKKKALTRSSWGEYCGLSADKICKKDIILGQFPDLEAYKSFARDSLQSIKERREESDLAPYFIELGDGVAE